MDALEAEFIREKVYKTPLHNIIGAKNILERIPEEVLLRTPSLRRAMNMVDAAALHTQNRGPELEEYSSRSRSSRSAKTHSDAASSGHRQRQTPITDAHDRAPNQDL